MRIIIDKQQNLRQVFCKYFVKTDDGIWMMVSGVVGSSLYTDPFAAYGDDESIFMTLIDVPDRPRRINTESGQVKIRSIKRQIEFDLDCYRVREIHTGLYTKSMCESDSLYRESSRVGKWMEVCDCPVYESLLNL